MAPDRFTVLENDDAEDRSRDADRREDGGEREVGGRYAFTLAPERAAEQGRDEEVRRRDDEQREGVEIDSLVMRAHWAS